MSVDLTDITFLILVRLDCVQRLENVLIVTERLKYYFNTHIKVREADNYNNGVLKNLLNKKISYEFVEDKDPVLYKTRHFNQMIKSISTSYIAIWDTDIVPDKKAVLQCMQRLRNNEKDVCYPYNGICYDIPEPIKILYFKKRDIRILSRHINKMDRLYPHLLVGGAVIVNKEKYLMAGGENEKYYGWGNDDFDRYFRYCGLGYNIYRANNPLFHLSHPRGNNSQYDSILSNKISSDILCRTKNLTTAELKEDIKEIILFNKS